MKASAAARHDLRCARHWPKHSSRARESGAILSTRLFEALKASRHFSQAGVLFDGKIVDLQRETRNGFSRRPGGDRCVRRRARLEVEFKNENLVARLDGEVRALVPDLISILDRETAETIVTERLKYGQRVKVVGASAPIGLALAGSAGGARARGVRTARAVPVDRRAQWVGQTLVV